MNAPVHPLWGPQPTLTEGITMIRPFEPRDAWAVFAWDDEEELARWFDQPPLPPPDEHYRRCLWVITRWRRDYERGSRAAFAVLDTSTCSDAIGMVELSGLDNRRDRSANISYSIVVARRRQGIATRAVRLACEWAFQSFGLARIDLEHDAANVGSGAVARAAGFTKVEVVPGHMLYESYPDLSGTRGDAVRYVLLRSAP
jgi:RimJ/RimL family protein N-acetyltransferase